MSSGLRSRLVLRLAIFEPEAGGQRLILAGGVIMSEDRIFEIAVIALGTVSISVIIWAIFSI